MKKLFYYTLLAAIIMLVGPWIALQLPGLDAMGACFLLFFAVNPLCAFICGAFSGVDARKMWSVPIIVALLFLSGVWVFFDPLESGFIIYAIGYLIIGFIGMLVRILLTKRKLAAMRKRSA